MHYSFSLLFLLLSSICLSQTIINGKIFSEDNNLLQGASVIVTKTKGNIILTYAISDNNGIYSLNINSKLDSLQINVSYIGYAKQSRIILNKNQILNFNLLESSEKLKEVILKVLL